MDGAVLPITSFQHPELQQIWFDAFGQHGVHFRGVPGSTPPIALVKKRAWPVKSYSSPTNHYLPVYHCPAAIGCDEFERVLLRAREEVGWDLVQLDLVPESSPSHCCVQQLRARGWRIEMRPWQNSPVIRLDDDPEAYLASRSSGWRRQLRNNEKRLRRHGDVTVEDEAGYPDWETRLGEAFALEAKGWKGRAGTAVIQDAAAHRYFLGLFRRLRDCSQFRLFILRINGRAVAFNAMVTLGDTAFALKISYDPDFAESGPGNMLQVRMLRQLHASGLRVVDLQYPPSEWKMRWATGVQRLMRVRIFADSFMGRSLYCARTLVRRLRDRSDVEMLPSQA